jgi:peptide/nickel transport system ATP-binding protein
VSLLSIDALKVSSNGTPLLDSVSLDVAAGEVLGVAGESGSGKTMTALAVAGLLPTGTDVSGEILFDGASLIGASEEDYCRIRGRDIGMVFQEPMTALNPLMTIGEQVAEPARIHRGLSRRQAMQLARETLDRVGLPAGQFALDRYPHSLSGGQRQRVAIAMAILLRPRLLIADEPTTALDVTTQAAILALLRRLVREEGMALMFVTHDLAVISQMADRVAVMQAGRVVEQGPVSEVFGDAQHAYTRKLLEHTTHVPRRQRRRGAGTEPVLAASNVVRRYPGRAGLLSDRAGVTAVDDVSLSVFEHEIVGLVGESGCGKSTLLRTLLGLDPAQGGEVRVFGQPFPAPEPQAMRRLRQRIQVVFQDPYATFDPRWRVRDLIAENFHLLDEPLMPGDAKKRVEQMLERVGLAASDADKYPHEFSGGQRQRIAIARALITEPAIIALDEAVSALDVSIRAHMLDLLAELSDRLGVAYLFVTHDLSVVRAIADRVLVMKAGRIVESGPTGQIFDSPQDPYTRSLLEAVPVFDRAIETTST